MNRLVCVEWEDAWSDSAWHTTQDGLEKALVPVVVKSTGWVVIENDEAIVLASSICADGYGGLERIPNGMIREVRELRPGKAA